MCQTLDETPQFTGADIAVISFLSIMLALMVIGTVIDVFCRFAKRSATATGARFLLPFSVYTNLEKMFLITTEPRPGIITCLTGMRVLSMGWVILGHQYLFDILISYNYSHIGKWTSGLFFQIIFNATVSTDSFYSCRGFCCSDNWWMDVLYVNNFLAFNATTNTLTDCLGQCWYTAVDTQLYLVAPFVLLPLAFYPSKDSAVPGNSGVLHNPSSCYLRLRPSSGSIWGGDDNVDNTGYERKVYYTPWCRMSAYIVGIWTGYIIFNQGSKKLVLSPVQVLTGWTVAVFSALAVLLGAWSYNHIGTTYYYDPITQVLYGGLHRGVCVSLWLGWCGLSLRLRRCSEYFPLSSFVAASLSPHILHVPRRASHSDHSDFQHQGPSLFHPCEKIIQTCGTVFLSLIRPVALAHGSSSRENYIQATQLTS
nr:uncharacterized protein LOC113826192 [Penaeus vannamei]